MPLRTWPCVHGGALGCSCLRPLPAIAIPPSRSRRRESWRCRRAAGGRDRSARCPASAMAPCRAASQVEVNVGLDDRPLAGWSEHSARPARSRRADRRRGHRRPRAPAIPTRLPKPAENRRTITSPRDMSLQFKPVAQRLTGSSGVPLMNPLQNRGNLVRPLRKDVDFAPPIASARAGIETALKPRDPPWLPAPAAANHQRRQPK